MDPLKFLGWLVAQHQSVICWLTIASSLLYALVILTLLRNARIPQVERWAIPFADTFLTLAVLYTLRLIPLMPDVSSPLSYWANFFSTSLSGVTNYLFILSAVRMPEPAVPLSWIPFSQRLLRDRPYVTSPVLLALILIGALSASQSFPGASLPDTVISVVALFLMGLGLYKNRLRTNSLFAWLALITSILYAVLYVFRMQPSLLQLVLDHNTATALSASIRPLSTFIALFLKFGFFLAAYSLMLWIASPLEGIEDILRGAAHGQGEFLESVKSICKKLGVKAVVLYIRQPNPRPLGQNEARKDQIARFQFSEYAEPAGAPTIFEYDETAIYHKVMTSGQSAHKDNEDSFHWLFPKAVEFGAPVFFHGSVIACLAAVVEHGKKFHEEDRTTLRRFADFISPAVQNFREMSALNRLSQEFGKYQIDIKEYRLQKNIGEIAARVQEVTSPDVTFILLERGFCPYPAVFEGHKLSPDQIAAYSDELREIRGDQDFLSKDGKYRWLARELTIPETSSEGQALNPPTFARFALGLSTDDIHSTAHELHPTIGTDATYRRAVSDLVADTLLDFIRGSLNELNDNLGRRLSGLETRETSGWHKQVEEIAHTGGLAWVVLSHSDDDDPDKTHFLGDKTWIDEVKRLDSEAGPNGWEEIGSDFRLGSIDKPALMSGKVIRRTLKQSQKELQKINSDAEATLWIGVGREGFGDELDEKKESEWGISPWRYFLGNFCDIADAGLWRLLVEQRGLDQGISMTELVRLAKPSIVQANASHTLATQATKIGLTCETIEEAAKHGDLSKVQNEVGRLGEICSKFQATFADFSDSVNGDEAPTCSIADLLESVRRSAEENITIDCQLSSSWQIAVSHLAACLALETIMNNAKAAIGPNGRIHVDVQNLEDEIVCRITDDGPGVSEEIRTTILKQRTIGRKDGHGWGLRLSVLQLRPFKSKIVLEPQYPSGGATFRVHFPLA